MIALTIVGAVILALFLLVASSVGPNEEGEGVHASTAIGLVLIIAVSGFLIAAGLFS